MIWLTWRQFRIQGAVVYGALVVVAALLVITGAGLADLWQHRRRELLRPAPDRASEGRRLQHRLRGGADRAGDHRRLLGRAADRPRAGDRHAPAGVEPDGHPYRLAGDQARVHRPGRDARRRPAQPAPHVVVRTDPRRDRRRQRRQHHARYPADRAADVRRHGLAPIGYTAFALALGVTAGAVIRRTVPAMAVTLVVFVAVQILMPPLVRSHLGPTVTTTTITAQNLRGLMAEGPEGPVRELRIAVDSPGAWDISNHTLNAQGKAASTLPSWVMDGCVPAERPGGRPARRPGLLRAARGGRLPAAGDLQPASRYWTLQAIETAIFLALAAALTGFCFWWVRRLS